MGIASKDNAASCLMPIVSSVADAKSCLRGCRLQTSARPGCYSENTFC